MEEIRIKPACQIKPLFLLLARLVLSGTFAMAALPKIRDPLSFANSVAAFQVVGPDLSNLVALLLPWLELIAALGLLTPWLQRSSGLCIGFILFVFIALHASTWMHGFDIDCGGFCTGSDEGLDYLWLMLRNCGLFAACVFVSISDFRNSQPSIKPPASGSLSPQSNRSRI